MSFGSFSSGVNTTLWNNFANECVSSEFGSSGDFLSTQVKLQINDMNSKKGYIFEPLQMKR